MIFQDLFIRMSGIFFSSFFCCLFIGSWFIEQAKRLLSAKSRLYTPDTHRVKDAVPTMGGLFILAAVLLNMFFWCNLRDPIVFLCALCLLGFGFIGAFDDWFKIKVRVGIHARTKFFLQCAVALLVVGSWLFLGGSTSIYVPGIPYLQGIDIGWLFIPWALLVIIGTSNAVNLTDGLDGLAIGSLLPNYAFFALICSGILVFQPARSISLFTREITEIAVIASGLFGACLGFLWFNTYPAAIFMGDVGSLSLGAVLGFIALMCKGEFILLLSGAIFVAETLSVMLQVASYKLRGKRIFKMAPLHHHFELLGLKETTITTRFSMITFLLCLFSAIAIKLTNR